MGVASKLGQIGPDSERYRRFLTRLEPIQRRIRSRFTVDTRALAALRISLGLIILGDLLYRAGNIERFYTDDGAYPIAAYEGTYGQVIDFSLHAMSGELWVQQLLFVVAGVFAVAFVLGYRTRLAGVVSLLLLLSLHARNPTILNGADRLLRVMLLVALVTPLGERWSIDALRRGSARMSVRSFGTAAILVQPLMVLSQNAVLKYDGDTWYEGEAVQIALSNDVMTVFLGNYLVSYPALLEGLNWIWVGLLAGSVVFLLLTDGRLRAFFALVYMGAFAGMVTTMSVGLFPFVLSASMLPFLTAPFWETLSRLAPAAVTDRRPTATQLGSLGRPPVERRLLDALDRRGYESKTSFIRAYSGALVTVLGIILFASILLYGTTYVTGHDVPEEIDSSYLNEQHWGLYSPNPSEAYSWYSVEAELESGSQVDALEGGNVTADRPPDASQEYDTFRDRKFMESVRDSGQGDSNGVISRSYAEWACEEANANHDESVEAVTVYRFYQPSPIDGEYEDTGQLTVIDREC